MTTSSNPSSVIAVRPSFRATRIDEKFTGLLFAAWAVAALVAGADTLHASTRTSALMASSHAAQVVTQARSQGVQVASTR